MSFSGFKVDQAETYDYSDQYYKFDSGERLPTGIVVATIAVLGLNGEWAADDAFAKEYEEARRSTEGELGA